MRRRPDTSGPAGGSEAPDPRNALKLLAPIWIAALLAPLAGADALGGTRWA